MAHNVGVDGERSLAVVVYLLAAALSGVAAAGTLLLAWVSRGSASAWLCCLLLVLLVALWICLFVWMARSEA